MQITCIYWTIFLIFTLLDYMCKTKSEIRTSFYQPIYPFKLKLLDPLWGL